MAGRPAAPIIINPVVLPSAQLAAVDVTPRDLYAVMSNKREWLQWLAGHHLIRNNVDCGTCRRPMALVARAVFRGVVANVTPAVVLEPDHSLPTATSQQKKTS